MAAIAYGLLAGYQIYSGFAQAEAVREQARIQAALDESNAQLAEYDAWRAEQNGQTAMARYQTELDKAAGTSRAVIAAVGGEGGSLEEITEENRLTGFFNKLDIDNRAYEQAMGYRREARNIRAGSRVMQSSANRKANSMQIGALAKAAGTAVSGYLASAKPETTTPAPSAGAVSDVRSMQSILMMPV